MYLRLSGESTNEETTSRRRWRRNAEISISSGGCQTEEVAIALFLRLEAKTQPYLPRRVSQTHRRAVDRLCWSRPVRLRTCKTLLTASSLQVCSLAYGRPKVWESCIQYSPFPVLESVMRESCGQHANGLSPCANRSFHCSNRLPTPRTDKICSLV